MCKCIQELQKPERYKGPKGEPIAEPTVENWAIVSVGNEMKLITSTQLSYKVAGKSKKYLMDIPHNFCPFCGERNKPELAASLPNEVPPNDLDGRRPSPVRHGSEGVRERHT